MIFDLTKNYVPESYVDSRDYRVFLRQLSALITVFKYNIDHFTDLYDAYECPDQLVPLLASMVGYTYNEDKSLYNNRKIIKNFPYLLRSRGSNSGIKLAAVLSINTCADVETTYSADDIIVSVDIERGIITIYYPHTVEGAIDWGLIEYVRPVGMYIRYVKADINKLVEEMDLKVDAYVIERNQYYDESVVDYSVTNFDVNKLTRKE